MLGLPHGIERSLLAKLRAAERAVNAGNRRAGCGILNAYIHEAKAQSGHKLGAAAAAGLIGDATAIRQSLGCGAR
jgi:3-oxoacyl-(acyl-carrier-protein) synthase